MRLSDGLGSALSVRKSGHSLKKSTEYSTERGSVLCFFLKARWRLPADVTAVSVVLASSSRTVGYVGWSR